MNPFDDKIDNFDGRMVVVKSLVGSHNYNLNTPSSDRDYKLFVCPTFNDLYDGTRYVKSEQSATVDYTVADIRNLSDLFWKANVNFIEILFSVDLYYHAGLSWIFKNAELLATMNLPVFYKSAIAMHHNKMNDMHKGTSTTADIVKRYGYDTKQASHALRLLYTVAHVANGLTMGQALWFHGYEKKILLSVKNHQMTENQFHKIVTVWHKKNDNRVADWFAGTVANEAPKQQTDDVIKNFVRMGL